MPRNGLLLAAFALLLLLLAIDLGVSAETTDAGPVVRFDFEDAKPQGWRQVRGLYRSPIRWTKSMPPSSRTAEVGQAVFCTHTGTTGVWESPVFELTGPKATFLLGGSGGQWAYLALHDETGRELMRQAVPVESPDHGDPDKLRRCEWDLTEHAGKRVFLQIVTEPVGYALGRKGTGSLFQQSFVVLDNFQTPGRIDDEATQRRVARLEEEEAASLTAVTDQLDDVIFAVRKADRDPHWYANIGHWSGDPNRKLFHDGARLCRLNVKSGNVKVLLDDPAGGIRDPQVDYDAKTILFSYRPGGTEYYHLYQIDPDGENLRQLTDGPYDDIEPTYLPDGNIMFVSTRCKRWVPCYFTEVAVLYLCDRNGENIRTVSSNVEQENTPWPMPDGRVMYTRWEYVERNVLHFHHLWTTNPDGTRQQIFYGNMHPGYVMIGAKPIPESQRVACVFCPGHGRTEHAGTITMVDPSTGPDDTSSARRIGWSTQERDPMPIGTAGFLFARWSNLEVMDYQGRTRKIYTLSEKDCESKFECHEPRPLVARPRERVVPTMVEPSVDRGRLFLADIYRGRNMEGVARGAIKKLLVLEYLPKSLNVSNGSEPTSTVSNNLERILGTVPVEPDGSAYFEVPALRTIFLAALDENDLCVKRMQSFLTVQPGEVTSCVGCHEPRTETPRVTTSAAVAMTRPVSRIQPIAGVPDVFDFPRDIQPILDKHCLACHDWEAAEQGGPMAGRVVLSGDHGPIWSHSYLRLMQGLVTFGKRLGNEPPYAIASGGSRIMRYLDGSHHGAKLSPREQAMIRLWIDSGAIYAGTNAAEGTGMIYYQLDRQKNRFKTDTYGWFEMPEQWPARLAEAREVVARRCNDCHDNSLPELDITRDLQNVELPKSSMRRIQGDFAVNLTSPGRSLLVLGPLAEEAGGHNRCGDRSKTRPVFADTTDPDYQTLLAYLEVLHEAQNRNKRFNMPGFRPSEHYVREMQRYGILPESFDLEKDPIDVYAADREYWKSFWWQPK